LGLLVSTGGYPLAYEIFEGNTYEGETLIPFLEKIVSKFNLSKPTIVADAGLLSDKNIEALEANQYQYIIGARIKNEKAEIKKKIFVKPLKDGQIKRIKKRRKQ